MLWSLKLLNIHLYLTASQVLRTLAGMPVVAQGSPPAEPWQHASECSRTMELWHLELPGEGRGQDSCTACPAQREAFASHAGRFLVWVNYASTGAEGAKRFTQTATCMPASMQFTKHIIQYYTKKTTIKFNSPKKKQLKVTAASSWTCKEDYTQYLFEDEHFYIADSANYLLLELQ